MINLILLARFSHRHWAVDLLFIAILLFVLGLAYLTRKFTLRYLFCSVHPLVQIILMGLHGLTPLITAIALPNNYLCDVEFFRSLYEKNGIWIPVSMILLFMLIFMIIGSVFSLVVGLFFPQEKNG